MLEIGGVVNARSKYNDVGLGSRCRADFLQGAQQLLRVVVDGSYLVSIEEHRKCPLQGLTVLQHIGDAAWCSQIVLQHHISALRVTDDVASRNMYIDAKRRFDPDKLPYEMFASQHQFCRNDLVSQDFLIRIDVCQELVECCDPLNESSLDTLPFIRRNDSWNEIEWKDSFDTLIDAVNRKGDSLIAKKDIDNLPAGSDVFGRKLPEAVNHLVVMFPRFSFR